jgi:energy-coupling factor transport system ATP-binding protein
MTQLFANNVLDEVAFRGKNFGLSNPEAVAETLLKQIDLSVKIDSHPTNLSIGEQRRVSIISQLINPPKILIVDEPTTGLDSENVEKLMEILIKFNKAGNTVIMISHDLDVIARVANKIVIIQDGSVKSFFDSRQIFTENLDRYNIKATPLIKLVNSISGTDPDKIDKLKDILFNTNSINLGV